MNLSIMTPARVRLVVALLLCAQLHAGFPPPLNSETTPGEPMSPEEAAASISLPPGFKANVFAAEPEVRNPIAMAWDAKGRLWIAENFSYATRDLQFDDRFRDRILIFGDENRDGRSDLSRVFTDSLFRLTGLEVVADGVYAICPPQLLFLPDRNQDDVPDGPAEVLLDGFTVPPANHHNFANGLRMGPDGWLYGRCGASAPGEIGAPGCGAAERIPLRGAIWRYHPRTKVFEALASGTTNPWGHDWNEAGDLFFINTVNGHFWHLIPGAHYVRPHTLDPNPRVYQAIDMHADHWHFDTSGDWTKSRDGAANAWGGGHAHSGLLFLRSRNWPESYRGKALTLNLHGRRINVERVEKEGAGYVAKHEPDFAIWKDPFFRGIDLSEGPDGAIYVLDWSDTGECHEGTGVHRTSGRIFRIAYEEGKPPFAWDLAWRHRRVPSPDSLAVRSQHWPLDTLMGKRPREEASSEEIGQALGVEASPLEIASVLQRLPVSRRLEVAEPLVGAAEWAQDHNLPLLVWYGLIPVADQDPSGLARLAGKTCWPVLQRCISRRLAEDLETKPQPVRLLLEVGLAGPEALRKEIVEGMNQATAGWRKAKAPEGWAAFAEAAGSLAGVQELQVLFGDGRALDQMRALALDPKGGLPARKAALASLIEARPEDLRQICEKLVSVRFLNPVAARGLSLFGDREAAESIVAAWKQFHPEDRPVFFASLTSRPVFASALLDAVARDSIPKTAISAYDARQIQALGDPELTRRLESVWGTLRAGEGAQARALAEWKGRLTPTALAAGDKGKGRTVFQNVCANCHQLYGSGGKIGPDLTGSGRDNLDYLLENILDPSAVVSADYQLSVLTLKDGRLLTGMVRERTDKVVTLQTMAAPETIPQDQIQKTEVVPVSLMPEGLALALQPDQFRDLIAYLMHPVQVEASP
ncbi:MAG: Glucose/arabinose dehydrogenase [Verrucomicrobia bacterium]|nr:MAG: Glucose/arabinose dehydrogenase [Verrucomicrobiota bacterium]